MIDNIYQNALKETYDILQNTDSELINKVPTKFISFLKNNMNVNYTTNIDDNISISQQTLLPETEAILALIYRSYWSTEEEKKSFEPFQEMQECNYKNINEIFSDRKKTTTINHSLVVVSNENPIQKFFKKILKMLKFKQ